MLGKVVTTSTNSLVQLETEPSPIGRSHAVWVAFPAVMPAILVIVPMMIAVIIAFAGADDAPHDEADESQQKAGFGNTFCMNHGISSARR
jgi:hypothetical protein